MEAALKGGLFYGITFPTIRKIILLCLGSLQRIVALFDCQPCRLPVLNRTRINPLSPFLIASLVLPITETPQQALAYRINKLFLPKLVNTKSCVTLVNFLTDPKL